MILLLLLASIASAQVSSDTIGGYSTQDQIRVSNMGKDIRSLLRGRPTITGKPTFKNGATIGVNGITWSDGSISTSAFSGLSSTVTTNITLTGNGANTNPLGVNLSTLAATFVSIAGSTMTGQLTVTIGSATAAGGWYGNGSNLTGLPCKAGSGSQSILCRGELNTSSAQYSVVSGGDNNVCSAQDCFVGGGTTNQATGVFSTVAGGAVNTCSGLASSCGGGDANSCSGDYSMCPGGLHNTVTAQGSMAAGQHARVTNPGSFVWSDGQGSTYNDHGTNSFSVRSDGGFYVDGVATFQSGITASSFTGVGTALTGLTGSQVTGSVPDAILAHSVSTTGITASTYGSATQVPVITFTGDGRATAASNTTIQIAESQVTGLTTDFAAKASSGVNNDITALNNLRLIGSAYVTASSLTVNGAILSQSSVTAGAFYGYGGFLSGIPSTGAVQGYFVKDNFLSLANGVTKAFTTTQAPASGAATTVVLDGLIQDNGVDYTYAYPTLSMTTAPASNSSSFYITYAVNTSTLPNVVTTNSAAQLSSLVVTSSVTAATGNFSVSVGIGTTSPARNISINAASTPQIGFNVSGAEKWVINPSLTDFSIFNNNDGVNSFTAKQGGNIGIGTTSPTCPNTVSPCLDLSGSNVEYSARSTSNGGAVSYAWTGKTAGAVAQVYEAGMGLLASDGRWELYDKTQGIDRISISTAGNICLGCATTAATLEVNGSVSTNVVVRGFEPGSGASQYNGSMQFGVLASEAGMIRYDAIANSNMVIENTYNASGSGLAGILFRTKTSGTPTTDLFLANGSAHLGTTTGTQLYYCNGGANIGVICRSNGCPCVGGTETALGIYVP